jgi:hypothetical protein
VTVARSANASAEGITQPGPTPLEETHDNVNCILLTLGKALPPLSELVGVLDLPTQ